MIRIFFLSQSSPILELFPFDKITLKSYICTVVTVMAKQCWSQTVLESGSWGHSVLQTPALVFLFITKKTGFDVSCSGDNLHEVQIMFSLKNEKNISKCRLLKIVPRVLSVKVCTNNSRMSLCMAKPTIKLVRRDGSACTL